MQAIGRAMGLHLTNTFKPCEDYALGHIKSVGVSEKADEHSQSMGNVC